MLGKCLLWGGLGFLVFAVVLVVLAFKCKRMGARAAVANLKRLIAAYDRQEMANHPNVAQARSHLEAAEFHLLNDDFEQANLEAALAYTAINEIHT
jgi:hypothetical protein